MTNTLQQLFKFKVSCKNYKWKIFTGDFSGENNGVNKVVKIYPTPLELKKKENAIQVLTL